MFDYYDDVLAQDAEDSDDDGDPQPSTKIEEDEWTMGEDVDQVQDYEEDEWIMGEGDGQDQGWEDDDDDDDEEEEEEKEEEDCPNRRSHRMTSLGVPIVSTISRMRCAASAVQMSLREPRAG